MPNLAQIYTGATTIPATGGLGSYPQKKEDDAARHDAKMSWLNSTITQEMFLAFGKEIRELSDEAVELGMNTSLEDSARYRKVVQNLTKIHTLRKIIETYGK